MIEWFAINPDVLDSFDNAGENNMLHDPKTASMLDEKWASDNRLEKSRYASQSSKFSAA